MKARRTTASGCPVAGAASAAPVAVHSGDGAPRSSGYARTGFTLFELLAVVGLMTAVVAIGAACLRGGGTGVARDAAVALLASRVAEARALATSRGEPARLMVHADPAQPEHYLRFVIVAVPAGAGWRPSDGGSFLPEGVVVLPPDTLTTTGPGAVQRVGDDWSRGSGGALRSTALRTSAASGSEPAVLGTTNWLVVHFSPTGGALGGDLVVAAGRRQGEAVPVTVVCEQPDTVAGLSLSQYGVATFVRGRAEF